MLVDFPFTTADEIAVDFRPDGRTQAKGAVRTLRARDALSAGVTAPMREPSGRVRGTLHLYCCLNRDAARLARLGQAREAKRFAAAARRIEGRPEARELAALLASARSEVGRAFSPRWAYAWGLSHAGPAEMRLVAALVAETAKARRELVGDDDALEWLFARVSKIDGDLAHLRFQSGGRSMTLPADDLREHGSLFVGAPLMLRWEQWGRGRTLLVTEPALDLGLEDDDGERMYPFERPPRNVAGRVRLAEAAFAGPPTMRRPERIDVAS